MELTGGSFQNTQVKKDKTEKEKTHEPMIVVGSFNTPLPITERTGR